MQADVDGALHIANLAADYDWQWTAEDAERFCQLAQFQIDQRHPEVAALRTTLSVDSPVGTLMSSRALLASAGRPSQSVTKISIRVTDTGDESSPSLSKLLVDLFADLSTALTTKFGSPTRSEPGEYPEVGWDFDKVTILLATMNDSIALGFTNPTYLYWWERDQGDEYDEEEDEDSWDEESTPIGKLTWTERREALLAAILQLPKNLELVLTTPNRSTIVFSVTGQQLRCHIRTGSGRRGQIRRFQEWFTSQGWVSREAALENGQWDRSVAWPARYSEYEAMVDAVISALREPLQVTKPNKISIDVR